MENIVIRCAVESDLTSIAEINSSVFLGDRDKVAGASEWVTCWFKAFPLYQYFVVEVESKIVGYAGWQLHGGFHRAEPVIELDQIGISKTYQGNGLAPKLTDYCMKELALWIRSKNDRIESHVCFIVWAYALNFNAINVYAKSFTDGVCGFRVQFGSRAENMLRLRMPIVMTVRN